MVGAFRCWKDNDATVGVGALALRRWRDVAVIVGALCVKSKVICDLTESDLTTCWL